MIHFFLLAIDLKVLCNTDTDVVDFFLFEITFGAQVNVVRIGQRRSQMKRSFYKVRLRSLD